MRLVEFGEALPAGTRLTLFSHDKPDRFFTMITFWLDELSGLALDLEIGVAQKALEIAPINPVALQLKAKAQRY